MIIEFSVANFLSFKDKVTFSMLANSSDGLNDNYIEVNNRKILKTSAIYGANASGKTNLFKILTIVISMLRNSNYINVNSKLPIVPLQLQNKFADFARQVDKVKTNMEKSLKELEDNFNSLMQRAFKGELFN